MSLSFNTKRIIVVSVVAALIVLAILGCMMFCLRRKRAITPGTELRVFEGGGGPPSGPGLRSA
jgi:hypothetical protein